MPVEINAQGPVGRLADALMVPAMHLLSGTFYETPQRTHFWNNQKLDPEKMPRWLVPELAVSVDADPNACEPMLFGIIPRFHIPIIGGWRQYVVLECRDTSVMASGCGWHLGWSVHSGESGVSRIPLKSWFVRALVGPQPTTFFAMLSDGEQIRLEKVGMGTIGQADRFSNAPLL